MKSLKSIFCILAVTALCGVAARAQDPNRGIRDRIEFSTTIDYASKYIWRGQVLSDEPVLQPGADLIIDGVGPGAIAVGWWGNMDLTDYNNKKNLTTEYDWTIAYAQQIMPGHKLELGMVFYYFPHFETDDDDTSELYTEYTGIFLDEEMINLSGQLTAYHDTDEAEGWYVKVAAKGEFPVYGKWVGSVLASIGWATNNYNKHYFNVGHSGFNDATLEASLDAKVDEHVSVKIGVGYTVIVDTDIERAVDNGGAATGADSENFYFMVGLHAVF